jgi:poly(A) polymerase Pap1
VAAQKFLYVINHVDFTHTIKKVDPGNPPKTGVVGFIKKFLEDNPQYLRVSIEDMEGYGLELRLFTEQEAAALANQLKDAADTSGNNTTAVTDFAILDQIYRDRFNRRAPR